MRLIWESYLVSLLTQTQGSGPGLQGLGTEKDLRQASGFAGASCCHLNVFLPECFQAPVPVRIFLEGSEAVQTSCQSPLDW